MEKCYFCKVAGFSRSYVSVSYIFKILQIVPNRATHLVLMMIGAFFFATVNSTKTLDCHFVNEMLPQMTAISSKHLIDEWAHFVATYHECLKF